MKIISIILSFGLILTFTNCEKHKIVDTLLLGKWKWEMTEMLGGSLHYSADSVDSTYFIEFKSDGYRYFYDNSNDFVDKTKYEFENENTFKLLSGAAMRFNFTIENDTLSITNVDGFIIWTSYYLKLK
jgi:hypothetical protein